MLSKIGLQMDRRTSRVLVGLTALGFLALVLAGMAALWLQLQNQENAQSVEHTLDVEARIYQFSMLNEQVETGRRGYLLSRQESFRDIFDTTAARVPIVAAELAELTRDNPEQLQRATLLQQLVEQQQQLQRQSVELARAGNVMAAASFEEERAVALTRQVRSLAQQMLEAEQALLRDRAEAQRSTLRTFYGVLAAAGVLLVVVAATTISVMLRYTRELAASRAELRALNEDLEDLVEERTADLHRANQEIQRFAYIVSHDLRSPLVNVMGFTAELDAARKTTGAFLTKLQESSPELVEEHVRLAVEEDLPEAIGFIRTSTQKMDRLINAILRLSREGRRTLAPEPLDMDALVGSIADSLYQRAGDAGAEIIVEPLPPLVSDRVAIEQILSNLVENGIKYLSPGRPGLVRVSGRTERDRVIYEVSDNGRGIDPKDHERIFDLFRRSGAQDQPGEGIGLAHVRTLAYRLGGVIDVKSELDQGATFRLSLPATFIEGEREA
ncbi:MAG TPA: ATP-binding protein [Croceibacterium sp.]|nr:ATP-binding protein [Croceibacterium sp.]